MVQAIIDLNDNTLRVVNTVKGMFGLKNKSDAVNMIIEKFEDSEFEGDVKESYLKRLKHIDKEKGIKFKDINELRRIIEK